ncbi:MAG: helix-turn-helix domain-containing protein [Ignavibacteriales bacterium]|nr:helix-turn-helix domain-containing protein [Ignavibacteriales bacterium]
MLNQGFIAFFHIRLSAPNPSKLPTVLNTIGDHIRKRRTELELLQKDVAGLVGVYKTTVYDWERGYTKPRHRYLPKVIEFLGYDPAPAEPRTLGEKLLKYRKDRGITQKELARRIGIDPTTLSRLEKGKGNRNFRNVKEKAESFLRKHS